VRNDVCLACVQLSLIRIDEVVLHYRNIDISPFKHENFLMGAILATRPCRIIM